MVKNPNRITAKFQFRRVRGSSKKQKFLVIKRGNKVVTSISAKNLRKLQLTKQQAVKNFQTTNSIRPTVISKTKFKNGFVQTVSSTQFGVKKRSQIGAEVMIKKRNRLFTFIGYSDLGELGDKGQSQAVRRALVGAVNQNVINYDDIDKLISEVKVRFFFINFNFLSEERERALA